ncbi:MAG: class I SAM-dependent methyltransferase [Pseudomonadota bacterium]
MPPSGIPAPSTWVQRFMHLVPEGAPVLDVACGSGRHTWLFAAAGHPVTAVDRDISRLSRGARPLGVEMLQADLEDGSSWPLEGRTFGGIVVTNYLHRPLFHHLLRSLSQGGILIYETFALGNEAFGRPSNPDFLLGAGELIQQVSGKLQVIAYETGLIDSPRKAVVQRICAVNGGTPQPLQAG